MPIIFAEDEALKAQLSGLNVPVTRGSSSTLPVKVRFGLPQDELATLTFPVVIIDHVDISRDPEREHRGMIALPYTPEGYATWWTTTAADYDPVLSPYMTEYPVPLNIDYEVTVLTREKSQLMGIVSQYMADNRIPPRFGAMRIPQDHTARRIEMLADVNIEADRDSDNKRIFRAKYALRVPTEILPANYPNIFRVSTVKLNTLQISLTL